MAKEGKVLEQKKLLQPLLGTPEGIHSGCIIIFSTSAPSAVYPTQHASSSSVLDQDKARGKRSSASVLHVYSKYCRWHHLEQENTLGKISLALTDLRLIMPLKTSHISSTKQGFNAGTEVKLIPASAQFISKASPDRKYEFSTE